MIFVLGTGRCGSTLVEEVLARHGRVGFVSNLEDRFRFAGGRFNGALYRALPTAATTKGRLRYAPSEAYRALDREVSPAISTAHRDLLASDATPWLAGRFRVFFERRAAAQRKDVFIHKFTGWPRAGFVSACFPDARFVHVVRDGRAVANSWLQMPWWRGYQGPEHWQWGPLPADYQAEWELSGRSHVLLAGILWKMLIDAHVAAAAEHAGRWLEIRHEDVVSQPAATFERMLRFAGLPMDGPFQRELGRFRFETGRVDAFRRDLDSASLEMLNRSLAGHLARFGYRPE